ncbi:MAG: LysR substrate-binding domain-containing protein [Jaaginema sp. PMC 1079.18]|nr:LysR substrate-binding domain-containing protein [Jaaginema sp. PMC 1080.18]MEC4850743.1 LysR substrate-binding domain-containing protein [Jaaginema sp. PMC 1079.18]MEC4865675.1 LysR substrate-binding domain-containing protein [Jaaginema sp. PMC 1078.18]
MEIYQVKVFLEVARCLSFTEAANTLSLTQPAVSAKIKSLESALGTSLFHRLGRRIELTEVGKYLLEEGAYLVDLEAQLLAEIEEIKQGKFSKISIGCMTDTLEHWLPTVLFEYRRKYPQVQTQCCNFQSIEQLYRGLKNGEIDLGISDLSFAKFEEIAEIPIDTIRYSLMMSSSHALAQHQWLSLEQLQNQPWVLLPEGTPSRTILNCRLQELGLSLANFPNIEIVDTLSLVRTYLLKGHYLTFLSNFEFPVERQTDWIQSIPLQEFALDIPLYLLMSKRLRRALENLGKTSFRGQRALEPIQHFITMLEAGVQPLFDLEVATTRSPKIPTPASQQKVPHFQSPNFCLRVSSSQASNTITLTIGTQNRTIQTVTAGLIIQRLGLLEHFLPRNGRYSNTHYQIQWWDYTSGAPIVAGLESKHIDIGILGDYPLLLSANLQNQSSLDTNQTRLISFIASNLDGKGNDVIVPNRSALNSLEDLQGRAIAVPFGSAAHGMMIRALHHKNLLQNVNLTSIENLDPRSLANPNNLVDGYAYFAPFHEILKHRGGFRRLLQESLNELPTFHGVVIQGTLADEYPEIAIAYLQALIAAQYWYLQTPIAPTLVSRWVNLDQGIITKTLRAFESSNLEGSFFSDTKIRTDWLNEHIKQLAAISGHEYLSQINLDRWIQTEFLHQAIATL